jgi:hypothetical protein
MVMKKVKANEIITNLLYGSAKRSQNGSKPITRLHSELVRRSMTRVGLSSSLDICGETGETNGCEAFQKLPHFSVIDSITVSDCSLTEEIKHVRGFSMPDLDLDVQVYYFQEGDKGSPSKSSTTRHDADDDDSMPQLRTTLLPSKSLSGAWDS